MESRARPGVVIVASRMQTLKILRAFVKDYIIEMDGSIGIVVDLNVEYGGVGSRQSRCGG